MNFEEYIKENRKEFAEKVNSISNELGIKAERLANIHPEKLALQEEAKSSAARFKGRLEELEAEGAQLSQAIRSRMENRLVECVESPSPSRGVVDLVRKDTGEVIDTRPMTLDERQDTLFSNFSEIDFTQPTDHTDAPNA